MKKLYLYFLMMFSSVGVFAKTTENNVISVYPHYGAASHYNSLVHSRLIAKSHYVYINGAFAPADSVKYIYINNGRGGTPSLMDDGDDNVFFDSSYTTVYPGNTTPVPRLQRIQSYQNDYLVSHLTMRPWNPSTQSYRDSVRFNYLYDANSCNYQMLLDIAFAGGWNNQVGFNNSFNGSKQLLATTAVAVGVDIQYGYDGAGNMIAAATDYEQDSFFYDGQNRMYKSNMQKRPNVNSSWSDSERWNYYYTGSTNDVQYSTKEVFTGGSWQSSEKHLFTYDANHNKLSDITQILNNGTYTDSRRLDWTYNAFNQPTELVSSTWNGSSWAYAANDYIRHFYYEPFTPLDVHGADLNAPQMTLYPVPVSENLNMAVSWKTLQAYTVSFCDLTGRVLKQYRNESTNYAETLIPVSDVPSGTYFIRINGDKGGVATKKFVVIH
ncbi:T9SS type A sorting domain-containing protein [Chitinophagaceae bacterium MMS25-I14]